MVSKYGTVPVRHSTRAQGKLIRLFAENVSPTHNVRKAILDSLHFVTHQLLNRPGYQKPFARARHDSKRIEQLMRCDHSEFELAITSNKLISCNI